MQRKATTVVLSVKRSKPAIIEPTPSAQLNVELMKITERKRMSLGPEAKQIPQMMEPSTPDAVSKLLSFEVSPMPELSIEPPTLFSPVPKPGLTSVVESPMRIPDFEITETLRVPPPPPPAPSTSKLKKPQKTGEPLTFEEHATFQLYYEKALQMLASSDELKVPPTVPVWATAIVYFKRFYLMNSMMDFNPKFVMVTALNLALKAEEQRHITLQAVADLTNTNAEQLVKWEVPVLEGIKFHLLIFHPFRSLSGLFDALEKWKPGQQSKQKKIELHETAHEIIKASYLTDAILLYTPSQIALAALRKAAASRNFELVPAFLQAMLTPGTPEERTKVDQLWTVLDEIDKMLEHGLRVQSVDHTEAAKVIDLKLKGCARNDKFKVKNEQKQLERKARREQKALQRRRDHEQQLALLAGTDALTSNNDDNDDSLVIRSNVKKIKPSPMV